MAAGPAEAASPPAEAGVNGKPGLPAAAAPPPPAVPAAPPPPAGAASLVDQPMAGPPSPLGHPAVEKGADHPVDRPAARHAPAEVAAAPDGPAKASPAAVPVPAAAAPVSAPPPASLISAAAAIPGPGAPAPHQPPAPDTPQPTPQPAPAPRADPPGPATQLGAAFTMLPAATRDGAQTLVIRLDPGELGRVQIKVERGDHGPARVELAVERTDTLMLLMQDRPRLDQALTQAGVPAEGRTVSFSLGDPQNGTGSGTSGTGSGGGTGTGGGSGGGSGEGSGGRGTGPGWDGASDRERRAARAWARAGIDITA